MRPSSHLLIGRCTRAQDPQLDMSTHRRYQSTNAVAGPRSSGVSSPRRRCQSGKPPGGGVGRRFCSSNSTAFGSRDSESSSICRLVDSILISLLKASSTVPLMVSASASSLARASSSSSISIRRLVTMEVYTRGCASYIPQTERLGEGRPGSVITTHAVDTGAWWGGG